jgi:hypothetical protein
MKRAKRGDLTIEPLPAQRTSIALDRCFSSQEMQKIRRGVTPSQMEDKWFVFWETGTLAFHRSWTGNCVYRVHFEGIGDSWRMVSADVNRDPDQYSGVSDDQDAQLISYLIDVLLLRQEAVFPSDATNPGQSALKSWSFVGRAALGEHPDDD